jgi:hypothetical protein
MPLHCKPKENEPTFKVDDGSGTAPVEEEELPGTFSKLPTVRIVRFTSGCTPGKEVAPSYVVALDRVVAPEGGWPRLQHATRAKKSVTDGHLTGYSLTTIYLHNDNRNSRRLTSSALTSHTLIRGYYLGRCCNYFSALQLAKVMIHLQGSTRSKECEWKELFC